MKFILKIKDSEKFVFKIKNEPLKFVHKIKNETINLEMALKQINYTGDFDGVNNSFVCEHVPTLVFYNGQQLKKDTGYTISDLTITITTQTFSGDTLDLFGSY